MKAYEISKIQKLKFDKDDIYIKVSWCNTKHKYKPRRTSDIKKLIRINTDNPRRMNKWMVTYNDSWIELTQLTVSGKKWGKFYRNVIWKALSKQKYNIDKGSIVL